MSLELLADKGGDVVGHGRLAAETVAVDIGGGAEALETGLLIGIGKEAAFREEYGKALVARIGGRRGPWWKPVLVPRYRWDRR